MPNKRVLIFSLAYYPLVGGAEVAVKEITDRLSEVEFDMVTLRFDTSDPEHERVGNVNVYRINGSKSLYPFKAFWLARKLHKTNIYSHIWAIMANWAGFSALFFKLKFPKVKYILTLQEGDPISYIKRKVWFVYPLFKKIFTKADVTQAISKYLAEWARDMGAKAKVEVIPNGVDFKVFAEPTTPPHGQEGNSREKSVQLITTSRLVKKNGVEDIIKSLGFLPNNVYLRILGTGLLENKLREMSRHLGHRVKFFGFVDQKEIPKYLHEADIFIRPSLSEGMGNSFIEAMASGLPVIATDVGGIPDFLTDPDKSPHKAPTGLFVKVKDPKDIARQVERLVKNPKLRESIITNAKRLVREKYDWNLIAEQMKSKVFQ